MFLKLRITFTILSAICLGLALPLGALLHYVWAIAMGLGAFLFYMLMMICKQEQERQESAQNTKQPTFFEPAENTKETKPEEPQQK